MPANGNMSTSAACLTLSNVPITFALQIACRYLKQAVGTVVGYNFLGHASGTSNLVTVLTVQQVL